MITATHEQYFAGVTPEVRARLQDIQAEVAKAVPDATPCISYGMPAFRRRRVFFYFGAFKRHIGIYPPVPGDAALVTELARWRNIKGNLAFPHAEPLPLPLIGRIAQALARQYG